MKTSSKCFQQKSLIPELRSSTDMTVAMGEHDVWDDTTEGDDLARERRTRYDRHFNSGYMEGIDVGKTEEAQPGFDAGYAAGVPEGERLGRLQGQVDALRVLNRQQASGSETTMQVSCLFELRQRCMRRAPQEHQICCIVHLCGRSP